MDDKVIRFFNKINFNNSDEFKKSKIIKVLVNKIEEKWIVHI